MIRSSGFVFSAEDFPDVLKVSLDRDNAVVIAMNDELGGYEFYMSPNEARELAEVLFQLAAEADPVPQPGMGALDPDLLPASSDFHYADEPQQAVTFQPEETVQEKLQRILDAAEANRFDVI